MKPHSLKVRYRAFAIWQKLGSYPWKKPRESRKKDSGDFYKGAFDSIPFLNDDAKRTFSHLLLRPGYMIRDYIKGDHERYLAPLTALIIFYAFFALVSAVLAPVQQEGSEKGWKDLDDNMDITMDFSEDDEKNEKGISLARNTFHIIQQGYVYLNLDKHPEAVDTRGKSALAALESTLRSQGIPLFIGQFFLLWLSLSWALKKYRMGLSATAAASAYILCQFSFFMLFAVLATLGESTSISAALMLVLLTVDLHQWLGTDWKQSIRLAVKTGILFAVVAMLIFLLVGGIVVLVAWQKG